MLKPRPPRADMYLVIRAGEALGSTLDPLPSLSAEFQNETDQANSC